MVEPNVMVGFKSWSDEQTQRAEQVVQGTAQALGGPHFIVSTMVRNGDPMAVVCEEGKNHDLIVIGSHGRKGFERFLLGSVSHGIVHRAGCSVLVIR
jgi:nucleotide-binding universal stress UspA family protein